MIYFINLQTLKQMNFETKISSISIHSIIQPLCIRHISPFLWAFQEKFSINTSSARNSDSFCRIVLFYVGFWFLHDSDIITNLKRRNVVLRIPQFVIPIIYKICCSSRTSNKLIGYTDGVLKQQSNLIDTLNSLLKLKHSDWVDITMGSGFDAIFANEKHFIQFQTVLSNLIKSVLSEFEKHDLDSLDVKSDIILRLLELITLVFRYKSEVPIFDSELAYAVSKELGIYRFRNVQSNKHEYCFSQALIKSLSSNTTELYVSFLRIFEPKFSANVASSVNVGEIIGSVQHVTLRQAWSLYLSMEMTQPRSVEVPSDVPGSEAGNTTLGRSFSTLASSVCDYCTGSSFGSTIVVPIGRVTLARPTLVFKIKGDLDVKLL